MPTISMFYGIVVRMYLGNKEHNPPHFHAYYGEYEVLIDVNKCSVLKGYFPRKQLRLLIAWCELHKDELLANFKLANNGEKVFEIEPLK